ncbi:MAG: PD40 domain-containing protein [Flavobacteriales bacterium]|nr:PD40 domain-containing protein [Flavobacteriales bacterium]
MKRTLAIIACLLLNGALFGQDKGAADKKLKAGQYFSALQIYKQLHTNAPDDTELNFNLGVCYYNLKDYAKSEEHFLKSSSQVSLELFRYKAGIAHATMKFKKAINFYNAYKLIAGNKDLTNDQINQEIEKVKFAEQAITLSRNVLIQNFTEVNTENLQSCPHIVADESSLIYCSASTSGKLDANGEPQALIFAVDHKENSWQQPKILLDGVNVEGNNHVAGLSTDGQTMFIERDGDIYQSKMGIDGWDTPVKLGENINSKYNESGVTITLDDKVMYFVSDRPGGFGGKDIYKVLRLPNGEWSKALNLGPIINTPYDEEAPFIHSDRMTLYFSSKGHQNMGGYDVFRSVLEDRVWSSPENLKYPVNTVDDDLYYSLIASGKVAYVAGHRDDGKGSSDIYRIVLKDEFQQYHVLNAVVKGKDIPIAAKITLIDDATKKVHGIYKSNVKTGKFIMLIDPEKSYSIVVEADNYTSHSSKLNFDVNKEETLEYKLDAK